MPVKKSGYQGGKGTGTALAIAAALLLASLVAVSTASAAEVGIAQVNVTPEEPLTAEQVEFEVVIENNGGKELEFEPGAEMFLYIEGKLEKKKDFLIKQNWTNPPVYLSVAPGEEESWSFHGAEAVPGDKQVEIRIEGPVKYGEQNAEIQSQWRDTVTWSQPVLKNYNIWIGKKAWGIKPSVVLKPGEAYTGTAEFSVKKGGETVYSGKQEVIGDNAFVKHVPYNEFYQGDGNYTFETVFNNKKGVKKFEIEKPNVTATPPPEPENNVPSTVDRVGENGSQPPEESGQPQWKQVREPPEDAETGSGNNSSGNSSSGSPGPVPGFTVLVTVTALLFAALRNK